MGTEAVGYLASGLVLSTFLATDMRLLRLVAILSNVAFLAYGVLAGADPVICLHALLLPLNIYRLLQLTSATAVAGPLVRPSPYVTSPAAQGPANTAGTSGSQPVLSARTGRRRAQTLYVETRKQAPAVPRKGESPMKGLRNFLLRLLTALEEHRQRQAEVVIKRYAQLIERAADRNPRRADNPQRTTKSLAQAFR